MARSDVSDEAMSRFERGLEAYFAADTVAELLEAVDFEALLTGEELEDPIDFEHMGELVGHIAGRLVVRRTIGRITPGQVAEQSVGYVVGGMVGRATARMLLEARPERIVDEAQRVLEGEPAPPERTRGTPIDIEVEDESDDESGDGEGDGPSTIDVE